MYVTNFANQVALVLLLIKLQHFCTCRVVISILTLLNSKLTSPNPSIITLRPCSVLYFIRFRVQLTCPYSFISLHPLTAPYFSFHLLTYLIFMFIYLIIFYRERYDFLKIEFPIWFVTCIEMCIISYTNVQIFIFICRQIFCKLLIN